MIGTVDAVPELRAADLGRQTKDGIPHHREPGQGAATDHHLANVAFLSWSLSPDEAETAEGAIRGFLRRQAVPPPRQPGGRALGVAAVDEPAGLPWDPGQRQGDERDGQPRGAHGATYPALQLPVSKIQGGLFTSFRIASRLALDRSADDMLE